MISARLTYDGGHSSYRWVSLIEKAFAKLHGCYEALEGGATDEALATLTGFPTERLDLEGARPAGRGEGRRDDETGRPRLVGCGPAEGGEIVWARLLSFAEAGFLLAASVGGHDAERNAAAEAMGLLTDHAYSLLRVVSAPTAAGAARLVCLRNPWGKLEWKGDWSDGSRQWTPELRMMLCGGGGGGGGGGGDDDDDGTFWMEYASRPRLT